MNKLEYLKKHTIVVADTGDFESIEKYKPQDSTTNPSLIYSAAQMPAYNEFIKNIIKQHESKDLDDLLDHLIVEFGCELIKRIPGFVSTEVDASLSFNTEKTVEKAKKLVALYKSKGVCSDRVLIKIAATWEGICAAKILEKEGIKCNLTLLFSFTQAVACAQANVFLISPFVGRILDWYKKNDLYQIGDINPGVASVQKIYSYYKQFDYTTIIMGASFRSIEEIEQLSGIDRLTIAPKFLDVLQKDEAELINNTAQLPIDKYEKQLMMTEEVFRFQLNEDAMASEKLSEGIRLFHQDAKKLKALISSYL